LHFAIRSGRECKGLGMRKVAPNQSMNGYLKFCVIHLVLPVRYNLSAANVYIYVVFSGD
jgi:hypothetical protein